MTTYQYKRNISHNLTYRLNLSTKACEVWKFGRWEAAEGWAARWDNPRFFQQAQVGNPEVKL